MGKESKKKGGKKSPALHGLHPSPSVLPDPARVTQQTAQAMRPDK